MLLSSEEKGTDMNKFVEIKDKTQLDELMDHVWDFHDAVISKIKYVSGSHATQKGSYPIDDKKELVVRFESVRYDDIFVDALELKFSNLTRVFIAPNEEDYTTNIMCAKIEIKNGNFIFVNDASLSVDIIETDQKFCYYIAAKRLYYRIISNS